MDISFVQPLCTFESNGDGENRTLLDETKPESDLLAAAAAAKAASVESPASKDEFDYSIIDLVELCRLFEYFPSNSRLSFTVS